MTTIIIFGRKPIAYRAQRKWKPTTGIPRGSPIKSGVSFHCSILVVLRHCWGPSPRHKHVCKLARRQLLALLCAILNTLRTGFRRVIPLLHFSCAQTLCQMALPGGWHNCLDVKCRHVRHGANHRGSSFYLWI